ncbi:hypothetical protein Y032_0038g3644 [Ancylostoma ceylanicum]|uniref:Uncharacterized protein n=1 Tax=Ancylostoma ceylanicum TaxID=53326 RepID=A0A016UJP5_9BILA|nr:hypothetical protein Y032_0038g3644 [Ancylostoma ceylanicum]
MTTFQLIENLRNARCSSSNIVGNSFIHRPGFNMTWKFITLLCIICSSGLSRAEEVLSVEESTSEPVFQYRESGLKEADGNNDDPILEGDILVSKHVFMLNL